MTILVAGYSSFPDAPVNPTQGLVQALTGLSTSGGEAIVACLLPVDWERTWPLLRQAIETHRPRSVLVFGLHSGAGRLRFELTGRNGRELGRADAVGGFPSGPSVTEGPETLEVRLPLTELTAALRSAGIDFEFSRDAGRYLCNDTLYRLCRHAASLGVEHYGFIHAPLTDTVVESYRLAGVMPDFCHTIDAESLRRAALALCECLSAERPVPDAPAMAAASLLT